MWTFFTLLVVFFVNLNYAKSEDPLARFFGNNNLKIGFGADCYMFWRGDDGSRKNMEFRCGKSDGDPIKIVKDGIGYRIGSGSLWLFWNGDSGNTKNAEFRRGHGKGDIFWIRPQKDGLYAIGFGNCPLFWRGDKGTVKNGEFRCEKHISDTFWIKGDGCKVTNVTVLSTDNQSEDDGTEIVGINVGASCSDSTFSLTLANSRIITETVGVTIRNTKEVNFGYSTSIGVKAGGNILGAKSSVTVKTSFSVGGAITWSSAKSRSTSLSSQTTNRLVVTYKAPGAAMIFGYIKRYKFNKDKVPARFLVKCNGGHKFTYDSTIDLRSKTYAHAHFDSYTGSYPKDKCNDDKLHCLDQNNFLRLDDVQKINNHFKSCFP